MLFRAVIHTGIRDSQNAHGVGSCCFMQSFIQAFVTISWRTCSS